MFGSMYKNGLPFHPSSPSPVIAKFPKLNSGDYVFTLVQPEGTPLVPVLQLVEEGVTNVPEEATPLTQFVVQAIAEMFVARHLI